MNPFLGFLIGYAVMVAIGALIGSAAGKPLAGILLTMAFGPLGWIFLFFLVRENDRLAGRAKESRQSDQLPPSGLKPH